jgi:hypothetical protein
MPASFAGCPGKFQATPHHELRGKIAKHIGMQGADQACPADFSVL